MTPISSWSRGGGGDQPRCPDTSQVEVRLSLGANLPTRLQPLTKMKLYFTPPPHTHTHPHTPTSCFYPSQAATISSSTSGESCFGCRWVGGERWLSGKMQIKMGPWCWEVSWRLGGVTVRRVEERREKRNGSSEQNSKKKIWEKQNLKRSQSSNASHQSGSN